MKIGIDIRSLMERTYSGVGVYTYNLLHAIFQHDTTHEYILFYNTAKKVYIPKFEYTNVRVFENTVPNKFFNFSVKFFHKPLLDKLIGGADIFFLPNIQFCEVSKKCKLITTIHDISFEQYPEFFTVKSRVWHRAIRPKNLCERSSHIIAVSENTKNDLTKYYHIPHEKISVIYSGISAQYKKVQDEYILDGMRKKYSLPKNFILYLGNIEPRKNIESIISAFLQMQFREQYHLVIAGAKSWKYSRIDLLKRKDSERIHCIGYVDENDKPALYSLSSVFVYPSFYEGFGFPPLEAMQCETPTIVSNSSSLPEIVQDASIIVDPYNKNDISAAIYNALYDQDVRQTLIERGKVCSKKFTWEKAAKEVLEIFEKIPIN